MENEINEKLLENAEDSSGYTEFMEEKLKQQIEINETLIEELKKGYKRMFVALILAISLIFATAAAFLVCLTLQPTYEINQDNGTFARYDNNEVTTADK